MSDEQRKAVRELIGNTASGMLFSICSKLDQFPGFSLSICLQTLPTDTPESRQFVVASDEHDELHSSYFDWIEEYSDFPDLINYGVLDVEDREGRG